MAIVLSLLFFLCLVAVNSLVHFQVSHFSPQDTKIIYQGDAIPAGKEAELINKNDVNTHKWRVGQVIYADPVQIWNFDSGKLSVSRNQSLENLKVLEKALSRILL